MGVIECASTNSVWRGYDYYKGKKVSKPEQIGDNTYRARVAGGAAAPYNVEIDTLHPRKSKCNCPHASGKRIVCKHMIATYFAVFTDEADRIYNEALEYEKEEERREEEASFKRLFCKFYSMDRNGNMTALFVITSASSYNAKK